MQSSVVVQDVVIVDAPLSCDSNAIDVGDLELHTLFSEDVQDTLGNSDLCDRDRLIELQHADSNLTSLFNLARSPVRTDSSFYEVRDGVLCQV